MMIRSFSLSCISFYQFGFSDPHNRTSCLPRAQQGSEEELLVVVGGRAAGVYGAIRAKTLAPHLGFLVIEKGKPLSKKQNMLNSFPSRFGLVKRFWKYVLEREEEESVNAGGVPLSVISLKTMESKIQPRLFFAGEVLNIDEISGGFNFRSNFALLVPSPDKRRREHVYWKVALEDPKRYRIEMTFSCGADLSPLENKDGEAASLHQEHTLPIMGPERLQEVGSYLTLDKMEKMIRPFAMPAEDFPPPPLHRVSRAISPKVQQC